MFVGFSPLVGRVEPEACLEGAVGGLERGQLLERDPLASQPVLAVAQLAHLLDLVAHRAVVLDHHRLHRLDQSALDVTGFGGLDGSIDQTLAPSHRVEVELGRRQTGQVRVLDETCSERSRIIGGSVKKLLEVMCALTSRLGTVVVLDEVRQCAMSEAERNSLSFNVLLPDTRDNLFKTQHMHDRTVTLFDYSSVLYVHLRNVDLGTLRAGDHHRLEVVVFGE